MAIHRSHLWLQHLSPYRSTRIVDDLTFKPWKAWSPRPTARSIDFGKLGLHNGLSGIMMLPSFFNLWNCYATSNALKSTSYPAIIGRIISHLLVSEQHRLRLAFSHENG